MKNIEEAKAMAARMGLKVHHRAKFETIIKQIMEAQKAPVKQSMEHKAAHPVYPKIHNTQEDVLEAIKLFLSIEGFKYKFLEDGTWYFSCRGAEESGNMSIPLRVIKQKAESVSVGRRMLRSLGKDNTYPGSYTDTILVM